jgi:AraC family transcriptional regulator, regulatory protein of adaptative response / DNA-3-methyladenine glycosylase II
MELDRRVCDRARRSRDARFDGRFFIAVTSTGIYCRPICPARTAKDENVRYYPTAAAAEGAGFRPCLRCRPEASPGTPAWLGTSGLVSRALRLIGEGALDSDGVEELADRLGVTARHLRRLFLQHLGATPLDVALTRRVHFAKKLLDETSLSCHEVAFASGFGSLRRFNSQIQRTYSRTPTELRRLTRRNAVSDAESYRFRLAYRPPYDWDALLAFLAARATPGVEAVEGSHYRRTVAVDGAHGTIDVSRLESSDGLALEVRFPDPRALLFVVERVRRVFDLGADPAAIAASLGSDPLLRAPLAKHPGIRTPGGWDGFELGVRAVLGQQISVRAATTIAGRIVSLFGTAVAPSHGLDHLFPTPAELAQAPLERAGVMPSRAAAIRSLACAVADGAVAFGACVDGRATVEKLMELPGFGAFTAEYIAMRALGEPDAFPSGDLILRRAAGDVTSRELDKRSEAWRPWRAYAVMLLWQQATDAANAALEGRHATTKVRSELGVGRGGSVGLRGLRGARVPSPAAARR